MSKMSMLYAELMEQCARLGFENLGEAEQAGYGVDWKNAKLVKIEDEQEKAHKAWLKERDDILDDLEHLKNIYKEVKPDEDIVERTINFIKEQCHD